MVFWGVFWSKIVFIPLQGHALSNPQEKKKCLNGTDINRLTEQKTGGDVNKNKLVTEKKRGWIEKRRRGEKGKKGRKKETKDRRLVRGGTETNTKH